MVFSIRSRVLGDVLAVVPARKATLITRSYLQSGTALPKDLGRARIEGIGTPRKHTDHGVPGLLVCRGVTN